MTVCDPLLQICDEPYFESVEPEVLALLTQATELNFRRQRMIPLMCSVVWAAVRAVKNAQAFCKPLEDVEIRELNSAWECFRRFPGRLTDPGRLTSLVSEFNIMFSRPSIQGHKWGSRMMDECRTPGDLIAHGIRDSSYLCLRLVKLHCGVSDLQQLASAVSGQGGFKAGPELIDQGRAPPSRQELVDIAFDRAAYLGARIVPRVCVEVAAREVGDRVIMARMHGCLDQRWTALEAHVRNALHRGSLNGIVAFPGRRPLTYRAARLLFS